LRDLKNPRAAATLVKKGPNRPDLIPQPKKKKAGRGISGKKGNRVPRGMQITAQRIHFAREQKTGHGFCGKKARAALTVGGMLGSPRATHHDGSMGERVCTRACTFCKTNRPTGGARQESGVEIFFRKKPGRVRRMPVSKIRGLEKNHVG